MNTNTPDQVNWYSLSPAQSAQQPGVDAQQGLTTVEAQARLQQYGPNQLAEKKKETVWQKFLRQYQDFMQIILLATGLVSLIFLQDVKTFTLLTVLGRTIYDNLLKYIRFQLAQLVGFILTFLGSAMFNIASGVPFTPAQILWMNFLVDAPPGAMLGQDKATPGLMQRSPRPAKESIISPKPGRLALCGRPEYDHCHPGGNGLFKANLP